MKLTTTTLFMSNTGENARLEIMEAAALKAAHITHVWIVAGMDKGVIEGAALLAGIL